MRIIINPKGINAIDETIEMSHKEQAPIAIATKAEAEIIEARADELGLEITPPISFFSLAYHEFRSPNLETVIISDLAGLLTLIQTGLLTILEMSITTAPKTPAASEIQHLTSV